MEDKKNRSQYDKEKLPSTWKAFLSQQNFLPVVVKSLERVHDSTWSMSPNRHGHFEMLYVKKGSAVFVIEGDNVHLSPNDIIIIKPCKRHKFIVNTDEKCDFLVLSFLFEDARSRNISDVSMADFIEFVNDDKAGAYTHLSLPRKNDIISVLERILRERESGLMWEDLMTNLLLMELFVLISRTLKNEWELSVKNRSTKVKELMEIAKEYIDANYNREIVLSDIAKYVFLSESYFAHMFKQEFNITPKSYILQVRVEKSKELLACTDMKISDIALSVGFSSQQRYNDIFRKYTDCTPFVYRRMQKEKCLNLEN